jgi:hypothetical protein
LSQQTLETDGATTVGLAVGVPSAALSHARPSERAPLDRRIVLGLVLVAVVVGAVERWWVASHSLGTLTSDGSVVGLMALQLLHHGQLPAYFWGQSYGGSIEAAGTALVFLIAGAGTSQLLTVTALSSALAALALWRTGRRIVGDPAALLGALTFWVWPALVTWRSLKPGGTYMLGLALALCAVGALARLRDGEDDLRLRLLAGLWFGLAFWASAMSIQLLVPAVLWSAPALWRLGRRLGAVVLGCIVGAWPAIAFGAAHGWSNLFLPHGDGSAMARFGPRFVQFFQVELPIFLDLRVEGTLSWINPLVGIVTTVMVFGGFCALVVVVARGRARRCRLPVLTLLLLPLLYALNCDANYVGQGRYVLVGMSMAALLVGVGLENGGRTLARRVRWPRAEILWATALVVLALVGSVTLGREPGTLIVGLNAPDVPMPANDAGARALLLRHHVDDAFADYWIAYRLTFETNESSLITPTFYDRYRPLAREVDASRDPAYLFVSSSKTVTRFEDWCRQHAESVRVWRDGGFTLVLPATRLLPDEVGRNILGEGPTARPTNAAGPNHEGGGRDPDLATVGFQEES